MCTNERLLTKASEALKGEQEVELFSETYHKHKLKLLAHILRALDSDPEKSCTVKGMRPHPWINPVRRSGQPRLNWTIQAMKKAWDDLHEPGGTLADYPEGEFNEELRSHVQTLHLMAYLREFGN